MQNLKQMPVDLVPFVLRVRTFHSHPPNLMKRSASGHKQVRPGQPLSRLRAAPQAQYSRQTAQLPPWRSQRFMEGHGGPSGGRREREETGLPGAGETPKNCPHARAHTGVYTCERVHPPTHTLVYLHAHVLARVLVHDCRTTCGLRVHG